MIHADSLAKRFGSVGIFKEVSLQVNASETLVIFGPNGSGKTTLIKVLCGLLRPSKGTVSLDDHQPRQVKSRIGYLGHEPHLYPHLTAAENLRFFGTLYGAPKLGESALAQVGLEDRAGVPARLLSRGEAQRVGLARALLADPDFLFVDEPFSGLDDQSAAALPPLLTRPGRAVVVTTHDRPRGEAIADRLLTLEGARA